MQPAAHNIPPTATEAAFMRIAKGYIAGIVTALACVAGAFAAEAAKPDAVARAAAARTTQPVSQLTAAELAARYEMIDLRARELFPRRRDEPLRYANLSDLEMREVQAVAARHIPPAIVNVSGVVLGCPCEEGPECTEQVYVVSNKDNHPYGLQLSRVKKKWMVGTVQGWWTRYESLKARESRMDRREYIAHMDRLVLEFPACTQGRVVPTPAVATAKADPKK
jgi:hypothetical protein